MLDFNEAMRQQEAKDDAAAQRAASDSAQADVRAAEAVHEVDQALRDLAQYLDRRGGARYKFAAKYKAPGWRGKTTTIESPAGFVLYISPWGVDSTATTLIWNLTLLRLDGALWRYAGSSSGEPVVEPQVRVTRQDLNGFGFRIGNFSAGLRSADSRVIARRYEYYVPFMQAMTELASEYLSDGSKYSGHGLTRI